MLPPERLDIYVGVADAILKKLYDEATIYVHTSLYEGFCLPAAQALAGSLPILYQSGSALDDMLLGDPMSLALPKGASVQDWTAAFHKLHALRQDPERITLRLKMTAARPSWKDSATSLKNLYNTLLIES